MNLPPSVHLYLYSRHSSLCDKYKEMHVGVVATSPISRALSLGLGLLFLYIFYFKY